MARRTKREAMATRQAVLDAAEICFRDNGVSGTTMASIAESAGWSRGAVYHHFKSKREILQAIVHRGFLSLSTDLESVAHPGSSTILALRACLIRHLEEIQSSDQALTTYGILAWAYDLSEDCASIRAPLLEEAHSVLQMLHLAMERAYQDGFVNTPGHAARLADLIASTLLGSISRYLAANQPDRLAQDVDALFELIQQALSYPPRPP